MTRWPKAPFYRPAPRQRRDEVRPGAPRRVARPGAEAPGARRADRGRVRRHLRGIPQGHREPQGVDDDGVRAACCRSCCSDEKIGKFVVPIVPDEARTFGMEALFRQVGIYAHAGQLYEPVDRDTLLYYKEAEDGQILEEGINEAGSMSSFIAAGTAYATHGINMIPFFIFYSMFGFQRVGDLIWAGADHADEGLRARRHGRPHDAQRRGPAARRRPEPRAGAAGAELPVVRPGVRLRAGGDHRRRHQADVSRSGRHLLLPDR